MRKILSTWILAGLPWTVWAADAAKSIPSSEQFAAKSAFAVEQRAPEQPLRIEQDCPRPEIADLLKSSTNWNTVEIGVSLPLGQTTRAVKPYTRYTCPNPGAR